MATAPSRQQLGLAPASALATAALRTAADHAVARFGAKAGNRREDLTFLATPKDQAVSMIRELRDRFGFAHLVFLTSVDIIEQNLFRLVYMLHNPIHHVDLAVEVEIDRDEATMETIHDLWAQAGTYQRELHEMFGIDFPGSPRLTEPFVLEGWDDLPPMRRDFDTKAYSEATYFPRPGRSTVETKEHMKERLYPDPKEDA